MDPNLIFFLLSAFGIGYNTFCKFCWGSSLQFRSIIIFHLPRGALKFNLLQKSKLSLFCLCRPLFDFDLVPCWFVLSLDWQIHKNSKRYKGNSHEHFGKLRKVSQQQQIEGSFGWSFVVVEQDWDQWPDWWDGYCFTC